MKIKFNIFIVAFIGIVFTTPLLGQKQSIKSTIFSPKLNRGAYFQDFGKYVNDHLTYTVLAQENGIEGIVKTEVDINSMGEIQTAKIICGLGYGCDEAVLNLLNNMPRWVPSIVNGTPKAQKLIVSIKFSLK